MVASSQETTVPDRPRLIEVAFPLKQASLDSVHEKAVRHGHISTLHTWPARRPLAACRAALIATLLPDPGNDVERQSMLERIGGKVVRIVEKKRQGARTVEVVKEKTEGGILHWGREGGPDLALFREEIRKAYGGRAPRVLDPFAGGGAIPLEAMRLGCEATAVDINPVAWFLLKCTLEYPQKLAGQERPLPEWWSRRLEAAKPRRGKKKADSSQPDLGYPPGTISAPLADHVRAWGTWVLDKARDELAQFYPVVDGKPTVAYLWAKTIQCKNCRATVPLLKTRWLCKKDNKRIVLTLEINATRTGVTFGVQTGVPAASGTVAQKREHDKRLGVATMTRSGTRCPCCPAIMTWDDLRALGQSQRFGSTLICVVVDGASGKEYRLPVAAELLATANAEAVKANVFSSIPFGLPEDATPGASGPHKRGSSLRNYGLNKWTDIFTSRQLVSLGTFVQKTRAVRHEMRDAGYPEPWIEAVASYLSLALDRLADYSSEICSWHNTGEKIRNTFGRFAFPIVWDFAEVPPMADTSGGYSGAIEWISLYLRHAAGFHSGTSAPRCIWQSSTRQTDTLYDLILTDPPYYDAIPYSDLMDFFHIWLRRTLSGFSTEADSAFSTPLGPKWNTEANDGELVDDPARHGWDLKRSKAIYEEGMYRSFVACSNSLQEDGRLVIVFAHKQPDAWETLVSALIRAGFVVVASWPIQTEMGNRARALTSSALSSSVWLVCKKRSAASRPGWDNRVLDEMRANIHQRLRAYWDAGIRGPDFVWAATGPALEAYSNHPVVKKATAPGETMGVSEFLKAVRRLVVEFVVGRVLARDGEAARVEGLDDITAYYLLHRHDFGVGDAPVGACILYAVSCGLSDSALVDRHDLVIRAGGKASVEEADDDEPEPEGDEDSGDEGGGSGAQVRLKGWAQRKRKTMGYDTEGRPAPLIDQAHRLMHLWKAGDVSKVDEYLTDRGLRRLPLFHQLLQALIELSEAGNEERALLESISNHIGGRVDKPAQPGLFDGQLFGGEGA